MKNIWAPILRHPANVVRHEPAAPWSVAGWPRSPAQAPQVFGKADDGSAAPDPFHAATERSGYAGKEIRTPILRDLAKGVRHETAAPWAG